MLYNIFSINNELEIKMNEFEKQLLAIFGVSKEQFDNMKQRMSYGLNPDATNMERAFGEMLNDLGVDLKNARDVMHSKWNELVNNSSVQTSQVGNYLYIALPGVQREEIEVDESTFEGIASIKVTVNSGSEFVEVGDEPLVLQYPMPSRKIAGAQYRDGVLVIEVASPSETTTKIKID
jgi:HSP20 family molecular chaperone IbpA